MFTDNKLPRKTVQITSLRIYISTYGTFNPTQKSLYYSYQTTTMYVVKNSNIIHKIIHAFYIR